MDDGLVRFGILGCAYIAQKISRAIMQTQGVRLYAIGSRSLEKAESFAKKHGFPADTKIYGSYQSVLDDEAVDVVYMPLPTSLHMEWVLKASAKKKHVLLEKPPALSTEDLNKIIFACESEGVQLMDCTMWVHHPRTAMMKELLNKQDMLGDILEVHASFFVPMKAYTPNFFTDNIRINAELDALGALGDLGWYCARAILWAYDYNLPESIVALPGAQLMKGVITRCSASFVWEDGRLALLHCSFHANMTMSLNIYGSKGTLEVQDFVIPYKENYAFFKFQGAVGNQEPMDVSCETNQTQESLMIHKFSSIVKEIKSGKGCLDPLWPAISRKTQQGVLLGLSNTAGVLAGVLGTAATGYILQHGSWDDVFKVAVGLYLCGALVWNVFSTGERVFD